MINKNKSALIAGIALLVMVVISIIGAGLVHAGLFGTDSVMDTANHVTGNLNQLNLDIAIWLIIMLLDILVAWALYIFFKEAEQAMSLLAAWLRVVYAVMLGMGIMALVAIQAIAISQGSTASGEAAAQIGALAQTFSGIWTIGLIVFGLHLLVVSLLCLRAEYVPNWLAMFVLIAAAGYIVVEAMLAFFPNIEHVTRVVEKVMMAPMTLGELLLAIWLVTKGRKA